MNHVKYDDEKKEWTRPILTEFKKMPLGDMIFKKLSENHPDKIIEINYDDGKKLTSKTLKDLVKTIAKNLIQLGIKKNDIVLFFSSQNSYTTPIVYACYVIGAAICPMELALGDDDSEYIVKTLNPTVILYDEMNEKRVRACTDGKLELTNLKYLISFEDRNEGQCVQSMLSNTNNLDNVPEIPKNIGNPDEMVAALVLTSGTTGRPKAICISHSLLGINTLSWWPMDDNSVVYIASPLRWISQVSAMLMPIYSGTARAFSKQSPTAELCIDVIKTTGVTNFFGVVGLVVNILRSANEQNRAEDLKSLKVILTGGERIPKTLDEIVEKLIPNCLYLKCYGMTELAGTVSSNEFVEDKLNGFGYIQPGVSMRLLNDNNECVGPGENGRVCIKLVVPYLQYWKNEKANSESFLDDGWFLTGDYGTVDSEHRFLPYNRYKDLIRCGDCVIIPSLIEKILDDFPICESNFIVGANDPVKGQIPVLFSKLNSNAVNNAEKLKKEIKDFITVRLPEGQMIPEKVFFVESFPYTSCGKVDKLKLSEIASKN